MNALFDQSLAWLGSLYKSLANDCDSNAAFGGHQKLIGLHLVDAMTHYLTLTQRKEPAHHAASPPADTIGWLCDLGDELAKVPMTCHWRRIGDSLLNALINWYQVAVNKIDERHVSQAAEAKRLAQLMRDHPDGPTDWYDSHFIY